MPFQHVSPNLGGLPRSNSLVVEAPFDRPVELERGLPAGETPEAITARVQKKRRTSLPSSRPGTFTIVRRCAAP